VDAFTLAGADVPPGWDERFKTSTISFKLRSFDAGTLWWEGTQLDDYQAAPSPPVWWPPRSRIPSPDLPLLPARGLTPLGVLPAGRARTGQGGIESAPMPRKGPL